jgi:putative CocE/NonD family hydrolase
MKKVFGILFVAILVCSLVVVWPAVADTEEAISRPGEYSGYSEVLYDEWVRNSQYVEVRDGTKLAVDIYRPAADGVAVETPYPVLFEFTPYRRAYYRPGGTISLAGKSYADYFCKYGYVIAVADTRGKGASYGTRLSMAHISEGWDAHDLIEWFASQPWCDGNIGMWGGSYNGHTQLAAATAMPPHLKAIIPSVTEYDLYDSWYRGGMHRTTSGGGEGQNDLATVPVDEDVLDENNNGYKDMLEEAVAEHAANTPYLPMVYGMPYRDSSYPLLGEFWIEDSISTYFDQIKRSGIAIYHMGGWYDLFTRDTPLGFINIPDRAKMLMYPGGHLVGGTGGLDLLVEHHRFYDYWLKGIDNGIMDEPPIYYYNMGATAGKEWRFAWQWPLPNEKQDNFYLHAGPSGSNVISAYDGSLSTALPTEVDEKDDYTTDYSVTCSHLMGHCVYDQWGLTYTTDPLPVDVEITGHPIVHLWVSSTAEDGDFFADLEDVDEDGTAHLAAVQGRLRASHRVLATAPYNFLGLPWHRSFEEDIIDLTPGEPAELVFDVLPTSYVFKAGHRIRLTINCASKHVLEFLEFSPPPVVSVYRNTNHASYISLPIIAEPITAAVQIEPETLNLNSKGKFTARISFPETLAQGYIDDVDITTVMCNGASAVSGKIANRTLVVQFNREDLNVAPGEKVELTVTGEFGDEFYYGPLSFEGSDTIRVMG